MTKLKGLVKLDWNLPKLKNKPKPILQLSGQKIAAMIFNVPNAKSWAPDIHSGIEDSSWVKGISYDERTQVLTVTFRDGFVAHYPDITKDEATDFVDSESKGRYVWKVLYNRKYY